MACAQSLAVEVSQKAKARIDTKFVEISNAKADRERVKKEHACQEVLMPKAVKS